MTALAETLDRDEPAAAPGPVPRRAFTVRPAAAVSPQDMAASLHVLACGSVDDGKSTLIGRLLWDTGAVHADQRATLQRSPTTAAGTPDFSLLVDGLATEREQGITIDIAWRYFDSPARRLVIIDSPGHEQYTRNMATGASHADVAILLVDARTGIKVQTRRHAAILDLMGVARVVLAVNKMDLVDWSERRFRDIESEFLTLTQRFGFREAMAIPVSAVLGDNVARRSASASWYAGPTLVDHLQRVPACDTGPAAVFRFPVQMVVRTGRDFRGLAGTVSSGAIAVDSDVVDAVSGQRARVKRIVTKDGDLEIAYARQAVVLELDTDVDISRGAVLASPHHAPNATKGLIARLVWLSDEPYSPTRGYLLRTATDLIPVSSIDITAHLDLEDLSERPASNCAANDIAAAHVVLGRKAVVEPFAHQRETGCFVLIDAITGTSVAGGTVTAVHSRDTQRSREAFQLTHALLRRGVCADLGYDAASEEELRRRASEVAILLRGAGVAVELDDR